MNSNGHASTKSLVISRNNIVDKVAEFLYQIKEVPNNLIIKDIKFEGLMGKHKDLVPIEVIFETEKDVNSAIYG